MPPELADFPSESQQLAPHHSHESAFVTRTKSANRVTFEFVRVKEFPEWPEHRALGHRSVDSEDYWTGSRRPVLVRRAVNFLDDLAVRLSELPGRYQERLRAHNVPRRTMAWLLGACAASWLMAEPFINIAYPATMAPDARPVVLPMAAPPRTPPAPAPDVFEAISSPRQTASPRQRGVAVARPFIGTLSIRSVPSGASVWVDQKPMGSTPLVGLRIRAGSHAIRIEHAGFQKWSAAVRVPADTRTDVAATLDAVNAGRVSR